APGGSGPPRARAGGAPAPAAGALGSAGGPGDRVPAGGSGPGSGTGHAGAVRRDSSAAMRDDAGSAAAEAAAPAVRLESGAGLHSVYALRIQLPVADPATLRLGRVEDDLIVGADGVRRRLRLAPVLRRCTVSTAELDDGYLVVRFRPDPQEWPR
uniref:ArsA family ATPase n=1 Tax=Nocardia carnea TaxID=37328 RepID=UPI003D77361B